MSEQYDGPTVTAAEDEEDRRIEDAVLLVRTVRHLSRHATELLVEGDDETAAEAAHTAASVIDLMLRMRA